MVNKKNVQKVSDTIQEPEMDTIKELEVDTIHTERVENVSSSNTRTMLKT